MQNLWYAPLRSSASREISLRSQGSSRATLVNGSTNQLIECESNIERKAALVLLTHPDVKNVLEQPESVPYYDEMGTVHKHTFDFLVFIKDGMRRAVAVKDSVTAIEKKLHELIDRIGEQNSTFADEFLVLTDADLSPSQVFNANLIYQMRRTSNPEVDAVVRSIVSQLIGSMTIRNIVAQSKKAGLGFQSIVRLIDACELMPVSCGNIDYDTHIAQSIVPRRYHPYDRIGIRNNSASVIYYRCLDTNSDGHVLERVDQPGFEETLTHADIAQHEQSNTLYYSPLWFDLNRSINRLKSDAVNVKELPPAEEALVVWRWEWVGRFLNGESQGRFKRSDAAVEKAIDIIHAEMHKQEEKIAIAGKNLIVRKRPSVRTLRRWIAVYETNKENPVALRKMTYLSGHRHSKLDTEIQELLKKYAAFYPADNRPTIANLHRDMSAEIAKLNETRIRHNRPKLGIPNEKTLRLRIRSLNAYSVHLGRYGVLSARKKFNIVSLGNPATRIGERIEMDEWRVPLQVFNAELNLGQLLTPQRKAELKKRRLWVSVAIDAATRCILGIRVSFSPSSSLAIETLQMVVSNKQEYADAVGALSPWNMHCGFGEIATDTGSAYISHDFKSAVAGLGAAKFCPPAKLPWLRSTIERVFGTFHQQFISRFSGRSFENTVILEDYASQNEASLTVSEFESLIVRYIVDVYHNSPHEGLDGETPLNAWKRLLNLYETLPPPDRDTKRMVFGEKMTRTLSARGVLVMNIYYQSLDLHKFWTEVGSGTVNVSVDPNDIGCISVMIKENGWMSVPCVQSKLDGVSAEQWIETRAKLRREHHEQAVISEEIVLEALAYIRDFGESAQKRGMIHTQKHDRKRIKSEERLLTITWTDPTGIPKTMQQENNSLFSNAFAPGSARTAEAVKVAVLEPQPKPKARFEDEQ
eukprot:gene19444-19864_t